MKKIKKRVFAFIMTFVMILGVMQSGMVFTVQAANETSIEYQKLNQEPMKESAKADSSVIPQDWGDGGPELAFDGNPETVWHTDWINQPIAKLPHTISWDLGGIYNVGRISYTRKSTSENGTWKEIEVFAKKADGSEESVYNGTLNETSKGSTTNIDFTPVEATGFKVEIKSNYENNEFAAAGEINVYSVNEVVSKPDFPNFDKAISIIGDEGKNSITLKEGETRQMQYELTEDAKAVEGFRVEWQVRTGRVATLDKNGLLTAVGEGKTDVSVQYIVEIPELGTKSWTSSIEIVVEKVNAECVIAINGQDYRASNLEDAIKKSGTVHLNYNNTIWQSELESIEYKSGIVRGEDFAYLKENNRNNNTYGRASAINRSVKTFIIGDQVIPRGLEENKIPDKVFSPASGESMALERVYLGKNIKGYIRNAFSDCRELTSFEAPAMETFQGLSRSNKVSILSLPNVTKVSNQIFGTYTNKTTTEVRFPKVEELNDRAFAMLKALNKLELGVNPPKILSAYDTESSLVLDAEVAKNIQLILPKDAVENYKADKAGYNANNHTWWGIPLPEESVEVVEIPQSTLAKKATATSFKEPVQWGDGGAALAFDNDLGTAWHAAYDNDKYPVSIEFSVDESTDMCQKITKMTIQSKRNGDNGNIKTGVVSVLNTKGQWEDVQTLNYAEADKWNEHIIDMKGVIGSKIRITVTDAWNDNKSLKVANIGEIHVWKTDEPGIPGEPQIDYTATDDWTVIVKFEDEDNLAGVRTKTLPMGLKNVTTGEIIYQTGSTSNDFVSSPYSFTFKKSPRYVEKDGQWVECEYETVPGILSAGYDVKTEKTGDHEFTVTYTLEHRYVQKTISVNWVNVDPKDRQDIQVQLVKHDAKKWKAHDVGNAVTLNAENNWTYTWNQVLEYPGNKDKTNYKPYYGILEVNPVEAYKTSYNGEKSETIAHQIVYHFTDEGNLIITNTGTAPTVDKKALQDLYDSVENFTTNSAWSSEFTKALENAKKTLDSKDATQDEVNDAHDTLEQRYYLCKVGDYTNKYRAQKSGDKKLFPYENYTRESALPMLQVWNRSSNANKNTNVKELKQWYQEFQNAEKELTLIPEEPRGMWSGPEYLYMPSNFTNTFKGSFHVTETPAENGKINLHVEFYNDGMQPYTGKQLEPYPYHQMGSEIMTGNKISAQYGYRTYDGPDFVEDWGKPRHLDGEDNYVKGYQMDLSNVNPGRYYFTMRTKDNKGEVHSVGYYYTRESVTVTTSVNGEEKNIPLFKGDALGELFPTDPTKDGYKFMGWNTSKDGTGTNVTAETTFDQDTTLYPIFKENLVASAVYSNVKDGEVETLYNGTVTVTITANKDLEEVIVKPMEDVEEAPDTETKQTSNNGWKKVDARTYTKEFKNNGQEHLVIRDLDGFKTDVNVNVEGIIIDTTKPVITVTVDGIITVEDVNLASVTVDGEQVELNENNQFVLSFGKHNVIATDFAGNTATWEGEIIDPDSGEEEKPGGDQKPSEEEKPGSDQKPSGDQKPSSGQKPSGDKKPGNVNGNLTENNAGHAVKTGDNSQFGWIVGVILGCATILCVLIYRKKLNRK